MSKVSVIGICGMSVFMTVSHFHHPGETLTADSLYKEAGGKGFNQAIAAARAGARVSFLAASGNDQYADECEKILKNEGINASLIRKSGKNTALAYILTDKNGENQVTEFINAELDKDDVTDFSSEIISSDILLLQQEVPKKVNDEAIRIAKSHGVKIILNPAPARHIDGFTADSVYMVTPNEQEAELIDKSRFKNCVTTLGRQGCNINGNLTIPACDVKAVDTTGAGDAFNGVLAAFLSEGYDIESACRRAVYASGLSVSKKYVLNSIPFRSDLIKGGFKDE